MANEFVARNGVKSLGGINFPYTAVSNTYTVNLANYFVDCTSGTFTVTLPTAVGYAGQIFVIKNSGSGTITVGTTGGQTIDGSSTKTLLQYGSITVQSDGANWDIGGNDGSSGSSRVPVQVLQDTDWPQSAYPCHQCQSPTDIGLCKAALGP